MAVFKFVIGGKDGKCYQTEKEQKEAEFLIGKKLGETIDASFLGMDGYQIKITGGSDQDGFPMRADMQGAQRKRILVTKGAGFKSKKKTKKGLMKVHGMRKKKTIRGNTIDKDIAQINCKVVKEGSVPLQDVFKPAQEETPKE